jgi:SAM-dependent methyltransferase
VPDPRAVDIAPPVQHTDLGYDEFAWFYDRYWAPDALRWELSVLEQVILERLPPGAPVLDVCCGSGHLVNTLAARGFSVTGVDLSPAMVELGRRNAPLATFHEGVVHRHGGRERSDGVGMEVPDVGDTFTASKIFEQPSRPSAAATTRNPSASSASTSASRRVASSSTTRIVRAISAQHTGAC